MDKSASLAYMVWEEQERPRFQGIYQLVVSALVSIERHNRDLACGPGLVLDEHRGALHLPGVQAIPLLTCDDDSGNVEGFGSHLDCCLWVSHQVMCRPP